MRLDSGLLLTILWLCYSLCLQPRFNDFRWRLQQYLPLPDGPTLATTGNKAIDAALEVLKREREREKAVEVKKGATLLSSAADQDEEMVDETGQPQTQVDEVDNALKILVRNATEEFGFIPRDVYEGVFDLPAVKEQHTIATTNLDFSNLMTTVKEFSENRGISSSTSHRVIVVFPIDYIPRLDRWGMDFKSIRIRKKVVELMLLQEDRKLREMCDFLRRIREGSTLAGWIFEAMVHRKLSCGWEDESRPQPIPMKSDEHDPPAFSVDLSSPPPYP